MHAFVMPNRGSSGTANPSPSVPSKPLYLDEELQLMMERADAVPGHPARLEDLLRVGRASPNASGWFLDSDTGMAFLEQVRNVSDKVKEIPPVVATHKGFALPGFDQRAATPRDVGPGGEGQTAT